MTLGSLENAELVEQIGIKKFKEEFLTCRDCGTPLTTVKGNDRAHILACDCPDKLRLPALKKMRVAVLFI